ncbi:MAG: protein translocase subunit SecF [Oscillospiraceae bacterium]|nr:protein translocase subunit SecF [Oscillospiraceae bacterium]
MKSKKILDIYGKRKIFFIIPAVIAAAALIVAIILGLEVDIEFKGGTLMTYSYTGSLDTAALKSAAESYGYGTVNVTTGSALNSSTENVTLSFASNEGLTADVLSDISADVMERFSANDLTLLNSQDVNPSSGLKFFIKCLVAVLFSFILLVIYIAFRFKKIGGLSAGVFALVALMHDVIIVFASFIFFRLPIDANFMAVILTILGYSINNTIVTYDRIRENRTLYGKRMGLVELMNTSVTQTMSRSINTTITTAFAALAICVVAWICGVESIISFAFPLFIGLVAGFYSSVFMSGSMWVMWQLHKGKTAPEQKKKK